jgi:hypothetical protein
MSLSKREILTFTMINFNASLTISSSSNGSISDEDMIALNNALNNLHELLSLDNIGKTTTLTCDSENIISCTIVRNGWILADTILPTTNNSIIVDVYTDVSNVTYLIGIIFAIIEKNVPTFLGIETHDAYTVGIEFDTDTAHRTALIANSSNYIIFLQSIMIDTNLYPLTSMGLYNYIISTINAYIYGNNNSILAIGQLLILNDTLKDNSSNFQNLLLSINEII